MRWLSPSRDGEGGERFVEPGEVIDIELGAHGAAAMPRSMLALPPHGGLQPQQHQQFFLVICTSGLVQVKVNRERFIAMATKLHWRWRKRRILEKLRRQGTRPMAPLRMWGCSVAHVVWLVASVAAGAGLARQQTVEFKGFHSASPM